MSDVTFRVCLCIGGLLWLVVLDRLISLATRYAVERVWTRYRA